MAEQAPQFLDTNTYAARYVRALMSDFLIDSTGVRFAGGGLNRFGGTVTSSDLAVAQNGTPNMSVNVAAGVAYTKGTAVTDQYMYRCYNDATKNLVITAAHATLPRNDLIVAHVYDNTHDASGQNTWALEVITGTAQNPAVDPTAPGSSYTLARVNVPAAVTTIINANITKLANSVAPGFGSIAPQQADVATDETRTSNAYGDLATVGPSITLTLATGQKALVTVSGNGNNAGPNNSQVVAYMSFAVSGASTLSASDSNGAKFVTAKLSPLTSVLSEGVLQSTVFTATAAGLHTFTAKYRSDNVTAEHFVNRRIIVVPSPA